MGGISAFRKEASGLARCPSFWHVRIQGAVGRVQPGQGLPPESDRAGLLVLRLPAARTVGNKSLLFLRHPVYGDLL